MRVGTLSPLMLGLLVLAGPAQAACQVSLDGVAFGVVALDRTTAGTGKVAIVCGAPTVLDIDIVGSGRERRMKGPAGAELVYELYQDAAHAVRWGDGSGSGAARGGRRLQPIPEAHDLRCGAAAGRHPAGPVYRPDPGDAALLRRISKCRSARSLPPRRGGP
jgi:hypothetical protein